MLGHPREHQLGDTRKSCIPLQMAIERPELMITTRWSNPVREVSRYP
jgi:hypothetical protein